jgi:NADPH:quinone reductase-like Zn-dependent oxidoreductase
VVLVDGDDLAERVAEATAGGAVRLAVDAVAGSSTARLCACLAEGGVVVNYGLLSGEPCQVPAEQTVFRGVTLTGFWLAKTLAGMGLPEVEGLYGGLMGMVTDGSLQVPVEATYPLTQVKRAVAHAAREGRDGKVLIEPGAAE